MDLSFLSTSLMPKCDFLASEYFISMGSINVSLVFFLLIKVNISKR